MALHIKEIKNFCSKEFGDENDPIFKYIQERYIITNNTEIIETFDITTSYDLYISTTFIIVENKLLNKLLNKILTINIEQLHNIFNIIYKQHYEYRENHLISQLKKTKKKQRGGIIYKDYYPEITNIDYLFILFIDIFNNLFPTPNDRLFNIGRYYITFFKIYFSIKAKLTKPIPEDTKVYIIRKCLKNRFQQQTGTCWVSTALNEFILSENIRNIIINKLNNSTEIKNYSSISSVNELLKKVYHMMLEIYPESRSNSIVSHISTAYYVELIVDIIKEIKADEKSKYLLNISNILKFFINNLFYILLFTNIKLTLIDGNIQYIISAYINIRDNQDVDSGYSTIVAFIQIANWLDINISEYDGGSSGHISDITYIRFFINDKTNITVRDIIDKRNNYFLNENYQLECAGIRYKTNGLGSHAICGFKCNDTFLIYDSNNYFVQEDWRDFSISNIENLIFVSKQKIDSMKQMKLPEIVNKSKPQRKVTNINEEPLPNIHKKKTNQQPSIDNQPPKNHIVKRMTLSDLGLEDLPLSELQHVNKPPRKITNINEKKINQPPINNQPPKNSTKTQKKRMTLSDLEDVPLPAIKGNYPNPAPGIYKPLNPLDKIDPLQPKNNVHIPILVPLDTPIQIQKSNRKTLKKIKNNISPPTYPVVPLQISPKKTTDTDIGKKKQHSFWNQEYRKTERKKPALEITIEESKEDETSPPIIPPKTPPLKTPPLKTPPPIIPPPIIPPKTPPLKTPPKTETRRTETRRKVIRRPKLNPLLPFRKIGEQ